MNNEMIKIAELLPNFFDSTNGQVEILAMKKFSLWSYKGGWHKGSHRQYKWLVLSNKIDAKGNVEFMTHDCLYWAERDNISTGDGEYLTHVKTYEDALECFESRFKKYLNSGLMNLTEKEIQEEEKRYG